MPDEAKKAQTFVLWPDGDQQVTSNMLAMIAERDTSIAWDVTIGPHKKETRSERQNRGYWKVIVPGVALHFGLSKDAAHNQLKTFFARVYHAEQVNENQEVWVKAYIECKRLGANQEQLKRITHLCSTTWATPKQFGEALEDIYQAMHEKGLDLPDIDPEKRTHV